MKKYTTLSEQLKELHDDGYEGGVHMKGNKGKDKDTVVAWSAGMHL